MQERNEQLRDVTQQMTIVRGQLQEKDEKLLIYRIKLLP